MISVQQRKVFIEEKTLHCIIKIIIKSWCHYAYKVIAHQKLMSNVDLKTQAKSFKRN